MASLVVQKNLGFTDGKQFDMAYVTLMGKWRTRLSLTIHREVANCIIVGARNARVGERLGTGVLYVSSPTHLEAEDRVGVGQARGVNHGGGLGVPYDELPPCSSAQHPPSALQRGACRHVVRVAHEGSLQPHALPLFCSTRQDRGVTAMPDGVLL
eukprot:1195676-Prorocentrum_minimum.AAC.10